MQRASKTQLRLQRPDQVFWQHRDTVLPALAVTNQQFAAVELDVLDTQPQPFQQTHAGAVEQRSQQTRGARRFRDQPTHFGRREHHRQPA